MRLGKCLVVVSVAWCHSGDGLAACEVDLLVLWDVDEEDLAVWLTGDVRLLCFYYYCSILPPPYSEFICVVDTWCLIALPSPKWGSPPQSVLQSVMDCDIWWAHLKAIKKPSQGYQEATSSLSRSTLRLFRSHLKLFVATFVSISRVCEAVSKLLVKLLLILCLLDYYKL